MRATFFHDPELPVFGPSGQALLSRHATPTREMVDNLLNIELAYLNTSHPDFVGGSQAIAHISMQATGARSE